MGTTSSQASTPGGGPKGTPQASTPPSAGGYGPKSSEAPAPTYVGSFINDNGRKIDYDASGKHYDNGDSPQAPQPAPAPTPAAPVAAPSYNAADMTPQQQRQYSDYSRDKMQGWMTANSQPYMVSGGGAGGPSRASMGIANEADWLRQNNMTAGSPEWDAHRKSITDGNQWAAQLRASDAEQEAQRVANGWGPMTSGGNLVAGPQPVAPQQTVTSQQPQQSQAPVTAATAPVAAGMLRTPRPPAQANRFAERFRSNMPNLTQRASTLLRNYNQS